MTPEIQTPKETDPSLVIRLPDTVTPVEFSPEVQPYLKAIAEGLARLRADPTDKTTLENLKQIRKDARSQNIHLPTDVTHPS